MQVRLAGEGQGGGGGDTDAFRAAEGGAGARQGGRGRGPAWACTQEEHRSRGRVPGASQAPARRCRRSWRGRRPLRLHGSSAAPGWPPPCPCRCAPGKQLLPCQARPPPPPPPPPPLKRQDTPAHGVRRSWWMWCRSSSRTASSPRSCPRRATSCTWSTRARCWASSTTWSSGSSRGPAAVWSTGGRAPGRGRGLGQGGGRGGEGAAWAGRHGRGGGGGGGGCVSGPRFARQAQHTLARPGSSCPSQLPASTWLPAACRRSASRIGESDGNINRKRIKAIREGLEPKGWRSTGF
jgi:hypothetical protein